MFEKFKKFIGGVKSRMGFGMIGDVAKDRATVSTNMESKIDLWMNMYCGKASWIPEVTHGHTLGLPATIASEVARLVTLEMSVEISGENARSQYLSEQFEPLKKKLRRYVEYACAGGGLMFKPYLSGTDVAIDIVQADKFYPIAFDSKGDIVSAAFIEEKTVGKDKYSRIEKHIKTNDGYIITNECRKGTPGSDVGFPCSLTEIPEWAEIEPKVVIAGAKYPLFSYFCIPQGNTEEPTSPLGVSVYARAVTQIKEADKQYDLYLWEYDGGALAVNASASAFARDRKGNAVMPEGRERLYVVNSLDADEAGNMNLIDTYSPELRDESYRRGLNEIKRNIENVCGLAWGTISDVDTDAKTATEIKHMKQRSYSTVTDIQKALQSALDGLITAMDELTSLYNLAPPGEYETAYVWDDSIVVDAEAERLRDLQEVTAGLMAKWEYRVKWYGEDEKTAKQNISSNSQSSDSDIMGFGSITT